MKAAENSPDPAMASTVSHVRDWKAPNPTPEIDPDSEANSAPAIPASAAEMQKASTRETSTLAPWVTSAVGESAIASSNRPRRLRFSAYSATHPTSRSEERRVGKEC